VKEANLDLYDPANQLAFQMVSVKPTLEIAAKNPSLHLLLRFFTLIIDYFWQLEE